MRRAAAVTVAIVLLVAACSGGDTDDSSAPTSDTPAETTSPSTTAASTTVPTFTGDAASEFCRLVAEGDQRPVLSPFEADIDAAEVELRMRNLRNRFDAYAEAAPPELEADLDALVVALADTDEALATFDYDFDAMAEQGYTISTLDDPVFEIVGFRLAQYRSQVC